MSSILQPVTVPIPSLVTVVRLISDGINATFRARVENYKRLWSMVWENPHYSPQEILSALGPKAAELFRLAALEAETIERVRPGSIPPEKLSAPRPYTIHEDGTVTLDPLPQPE